MNRQELEGMMRKEIGRNICYCRAGGGAGSIILLELDNKDSYWMSGYWWLPLPILQNTILVAVNQLFINSCFVTQNQ